MGPLDHSPIGAHKQVEIEIPLKLENEDILRCVHTKFPPRVY